MEEPRERLTDGKEELGTHLGKVDGEVTREIVSRRELREVVVEAPSSGDGERTALTDTSSERLAEPLDLLLLVDKRNGMTRGQSFVLGNAVIRTREREKKTHDKLSRADENTVSLRGRNGNDGQRLREQGTRVREKKCSDAPSDRRTETLRHAKRHRVERSAELFKAHTRLRDDFPHACAVAVHDDAFSAHPVTDSDDLLLREYHYGRASEQQVGERARSIFESP